MPNGADQRNIVPLITNCFNDFLERNQDAVKDAAQQWYPIEKETEFFTAQIQQKEWIESSSQFKAIRKYLKFNDKGEQFRYDLRTAAFRKKRREIQVVTFAEVNNPVLFTNIGKQPLTGQPVPTGTQIPEGVQPEPSGAQPIPSASQPLPQGAQEIPSGVQPEQTTGQPANTIRPWALQTQFGTVGTGRPPFRPTSPPGRLPLSAHLPPTPETPGRHKRVKPGTPVPPPNIRVIYPAPQKGTAPPLEQERRKPAWEDYRPIPIEIEDLQTSAPEQEQEAQVKRATSVPETTRSVLELAKIQQQLAARRRLKGIFAKVIFYLKITKALREYFVEIAAELKRFKQHHPICYAKVLQYYQQWYTTSSKNIKNKYRVNKPKLRW